MTIKKQLRATYGLDQAGEKIINVGMPTELTDGVNIQYFIDNNTVQEYDPTRGYDEHFIISYKRKLYSAARKITKPAGNFALQDWNEIRVDTLWQSFNHQSTFELSPEAGSQILYDVRFAQRSIILPTDPTHGDAVWIKDNFNALPYNKLTVHTRKFQLQNGSAEFNPQIPGEMNMFVWDAGQKYWRIFRFISESTQDGIKSTPRFNQNEVIQVGVNQTVVVNSLEKNHEIKFPIFANDNERITIIDEHQNLGQNPLKIHCFNNTYKINNKTGFYMLDKPGVTTFIFKKSDNNWHPVFEVTNSWKKISQNYKTKAFEKLHLQPTQNIEITLPDNAQIGDEITLTNVTGYQYQVTIIPTGDHKIVGDINQYYNRKYSQLTKGTPELTTRFVLPNNGQGTLVQLTYLEDNKWYVQDFQTRVEHVDETTRTRPGIASLADQNEVNKNHEDNPRDDQIITPKTLANKTQTETRRGVQRIATLDEVNLPTSGNHLHDIIVTPKQLNNRQATEEIRGLAETATNTEVKDNNNDTHIITPKKLDHRRATETLSGVALLVNTNNPTSASSRTTEGTGVYKHLTNNIDIVTPKSLSQAQATETSKGVAYISTQQEANEAKENAQDSVIITPKKLANRTALENRTGVARMVNRAGNEHKKNINDSLHSEVFITPKALAEREATEDLSGIAFIATQNDVDSGELDTKIITPKKFKAYNKYDHFITQTNSGIEHSGNIWDKVTFNIRESSETQRGTLRTATQDESNVRTSQASDLLYITPKKLNGRRAKEDLEGIARIATNQEVDAGTLNAEQFITPAKLTRWTRVSANAQATEENRGVGKVANIQEAWVGNQTVGQTKSYQDYSDQYIITPRKLNYTLQNYLPLKGKAFDQDKLDDLDSTQFLRSDVDTTSTAKLTVNKQTRVGALFLNPIANIETALTTNVIKDKTGGLIYQNGANFTFDNNIENADKFIFDINGQQKAELTKNGEFKTTTTDTTNVNTQNLNVTNTMTFKNRSFDDYFVKSDGHTMTGDLSVNKNGVVTVGNASIKTNQNNQNWDLINNNGFQIKHNNQNVLSFDNQDIATFKSAVKVGNTEVIDSSAKIDYQRLKNVPQANITQFGIIKLSNELDDSSEQLAPQMKVFADLKAIVDQKADTVGQSYKNLRIKEYLQIGNIRLIPDYANKTVKFVWADTQEEAV